MRFTQGSLRQTSFPALVLHGPRRLLAVLAPLPEIEPPWRTAVSSVVRSRRVQVDWPPEWLNRARVNQSIGSHCGLIPAVAVKCSSVEGTPAPRGSAGCRLVVGRAEILEGDLWTCGLAGKLAHLLQLLFTSAFI